MYSFLVFGCKGTAFPENKCFGSVKNVEMRAIGCIIRYLGGEKGVTALTAVTGMRVAA